MSLSCINCFRYAPLVPRFGTRSTTSCTRWKPVQFVLHPDIEGGRDRSLFLVAPDVEVPVGPAVGQPVDQPRVTMKAEDDVLILGEE